MRNWEVFFWGLRWIARLACLWIWSCGLAAMGQTLGTDTNAPPAAREKVVLPKSVPDPIEPFNRAMWDFNKALMTDVIKPTSRVYRFVIRRPIRTGLGNMGRNLTYPDRLFNNLLQGKWSGARDETYRFLCNTTVGIVGFWDVATHWKIPKSDADFGQTFGQWGWQPQCFIMLPIFGPSSERDTVGLAADTASNPLLYISPYDFAADDPLTYLGPYSYFTYAVMYNNFSDSVNQYVRFSQAEMDPYSEIQYAWTFARDNRVADYQVKGEKDEASLESMESIFFTYRNPEFFNHSQTRSVRIPSTGKRLKFTYWLQPKSANVVYIVPGLGGHRLAQTAMALAEVVFKHGYSAVVVSSPFNSEFMEHASTAALPAYLPVDGHDLQVALTEIDRDLNGRYPHRLRQKTLMGYSMGALETLFVAATAPSNSLLQFDRYVAIDSPVRLEYGISKLDELYEAPLQWPATERASDLENTFIKVAALNSTTPTQQPTLPFNAIESKFLIGMDFRLVLRDIIYSTQRRNNQGVLQHPIRSWRRAPLYQEIMQYSYEDYFKRFVIPYYQHQNLPAPTAEALSTAGDLRSYTDGLRRNPNIRVMVNQNDFLLPAEDLTWLHTIFSTNQLTVFNHGGHLGNLADPTVQAAIIGALPPVRPADQIHCKNIDH